MPMEIRSTLEIWWSGVSITNKENIGGTVSIENLVIVRL
jgi:hypothetical protein